MGRNVIALKALYVALAGVLPDASKATAGQVLTVVDGEWKAANLPD